MRYGYVIDKINKAEMQNTPFKHIEINDLFSPQDFAEIISCPEIAVAEARDDERLFQNLFAAGYRIIPFPGTVENYRRYIRWHRRKKLSHEVNTTCEGFGVVLRLMEQRSAAMTEIDSLLTSAEFVEAIAQRFDVDPRDCKYDAGLQKYLDGYEISPHPDVRRKALTFMVNVNPNPHSENEAHHTHYLIFRRERDYVREFWRSNPSVDTCWVPWDWCESAKQQIKNNSIVIFAPQSDTLHGIKADYEHHQYQRTQLYGNLWYTDRRCEMRPQWEQLDLLADNKPAAQLSPLTTALANVVPWRVRSAWMRFSKGTRGSTHAKRSL
jgi:hypothetical protein